MQAKQPDEPLSWAQTQPRHMAQGVYLCGKTTPEVNRILRAFKERFEASRLELILDDANCHNINQKKSASIFFHAQDVPEPTLPYFFKKRPLPPGKMTFNQVSMALTNNNKIQEVLAYLRSIDVNALKQQHQEQDTGATGAGDVLTLLAEARTLVRRLESPFQYVHGVTTHATQLAHAMVVLDDLGVWTAWRRHAPQEVVQVVGGGAARGGRREEGKEEEEGASSLTELWERCVVTTPCDIALLRESFLSLLFFLFFAPMPIRSCRPSGKNSDGS